MPESKLSGPGIVMRPVRPWWHQVSGRAMLQVALAALLVAPPAVAQINTPVGFREPPAIRWWHGAVVLGGLSALMLLDQPTGHYVQKRRSATVDDLSRTLRHFGQPEVYGTITLGLVAAGLVSHNEEVSRAGGRLAATLALAGASSSLTKFAFGRPRPSESTDADVFAPFAGGDAMPSGHSTMAFALATALADDIHETWASVGLYTLATGVAWSRLNDNRHWLSDVAAGAVVGIASAKLVNGRWRLFNLRPPSILLGPRHAGIAWQLTF
jgi:membrane-associated phospholipid phosphatase